MSLFEELRRRNVFRVGIAYVITAWLLAQVADLAADAFGAPDWFMRMLIVVLALGLPVALFFAWAFELTPEGIKREQDVDRSQSVTKQTGQRLNQLIIAVLAIAVMVLLADRFWFSDRSPNAGSGEALDKSIAVLPFDDFSPGGDQGWFADGLAEEILNALSKAPDLKVASRTASFRFKDSDQPLDTIADQLGVAHILEGSVRRAGDDIRVTAQLIRADDGFHLWSENFDGSAEDAIRIQEEISAAIAQALETAMDPAALKAVVDAGTTSVAAYEALLRGLAKVGEASVAGTAAPMQDALKAFQSATRIDPSFARAHYQLARAWLTDLQAASFLGGYTGLANKTVLANFEDAIGHALEHGRGDERLLYEGIAALGQLRLADARDRLARYIQLRPNDTSVRSELIDVAIWTADHDLSRRVLGMLEKSAELDQLIDAMQGYHRIGDPSQGARVARKTLQLAPTVSAVIYQAHRSLLWDGAIEEAASLVPRIIAMDTPRAHLLSQLRQVCAEGRKADAERLFDDYEAISKDDPSWRWHAVSLLQTPEKASESLQPIYDRGNLYGLAAFLQYPQFDPRPFPDLMAVLTREGVNRPDPIRPPFACELAGDDQNSVAVLPFAALSSGEDDEYFADGLTEEIINSLTRLPELLVTARTSAFAFKAVNKEVPEIADALGVNHVVEGSVRRAGDRLRITAQLIRASDGFHLWSQTYDRTLDDVFAVQEDIAESVARALDVVLDETKRRQMTLAGTRNVEAFIAFQKGRELYDLAHGVLPQIATLRRANEQFEAAIALAPDLAEAHLLHSDLYTHLLLSQADGEEDAAMLTEEALVEAREHLRADLKAAADHALVPARRAGAELARILVSDDWQSLSRAVQQRLGAEGCASSLWIQTVSPLGWASQLADLFDQLLECDPFREPHWMHGAQVHLWAGNFDEALHLVKRGIERDPEFIRLVRVKNRVLRAQSDWAALEGVGGTGHVEIPEELLTRAARDSASASHLREWGKGRKLSDEGQLFLAVVSGDRDLANRMASRIDARPLGPMALLQATYHCACGAMFDLESTPNFAQRLREANAQWPPPVRVKYQAKEW